jgi:LPS-assembly lipoprotein
MSRRLAPPLALLSAAVLGGCGFTPLYGAPGVGSGLAHIEVVAPEGRVGYLLREDIDDALGHDKTAAPTYRLEMTIGQSRAAHGLTVSGVSQRFEIDLSVDYTLVELATGKVAHRGHVISDISYDSTVQPYAGIAARQNTQERVAADAANKIQLELSAWLAGRSRSEPEARVR